MARLTGCIPLLLVLAMVGTTVLCAYVNQLIRSQVKAMEHGFVERTAEPLLPRGGRRLLGIEKAPIWFPDLQFENSDGVGEISRDGMARVEVSGGFRSQVVLQLPQRVLRDEPVTDHEKLTLEDMLEDMTVEDMAVEDMTLENMPADDHDESGYELSEEDSGIPHSI